MWQFHLSMRTMGKITGVNHQNYCFRKMNLVVSSLEKQLDMERATVRHKKMREIRETSTLWQDVDNDRKGGAQSDRKFELMWRRECTLGRLAGKQPFACEKVCLLYIGHGPWEVRTSTGWRKKAPFLAWMTSNTELAWLVQCLTVVRNQENMESSYGSVIARV